MADVGKSPEMVETCYASCRPACESSCIDEEYALFTVQEIICGKVNLVSFTCILRTVPYLTLFTVQEIICGKVSLSDLPAYLTNNMLYSING